MVTFPRIALDGDDSSPPTPPTPPAPPKRRRMRFVGPPRNLRPGTIVFNVEHIGEGSQRAADCLGILVGKSAWGMAQVVTSAGNLDEWNWDDMRAGKPHSAFDRLTDTACAIMLEDATFGGLFKAAVSKRTKRARKVA